MITDKDKLLAEIRQELVANLDVAVIGMSGGADSTLTACLCKDALGVENVYGLHMAYDMVDEDKFNANSKRVTEKLGVHSINVPIRYIADAINIALRQNKGVPKISQVNKGNMRSRARMCTLYSVSHALGDELGKRVRVIGTGNLSEDFIGYDTKGGDALADIFPIGELVKSEVYQLLEHYRDLEWITEDMIDRVPSAGLWEGQTDEEELGYSYDQLEPAIKSMWKLATFGNDLPQQLNEIEQFVMNRHEINRHKHQAPPVIKLRQFCE